MHHSRQYRAVICVLAAQTPTQQQTTGIALNKTYLENVGGCGIRVPCLYKVKLPSHGQRVIDSRFGKRHVHLDAVYLRVGLCVGLLVPCTQVLCVVYLCPVVASRGVQVI